MHKTALLLIYFTVDSNFTEISLETCVNAQSDGVVTRQGWLGWLGRAGHKDRTLSTVGEEGEGIKNHRTQQLNPIPLILAGMPEPGSLCLN